MLTLTNVVKAYRERGHQSRSRFLAVDGVSLDVPAGQLFTLLGPSGCGKTTTLRMVAGLETPDSGTVSVGGKTMFSSARRVNVPPHRRGLGMVFQSYAIWPNMSVQRNISYALAGVHGKERPSRAERAARIKRALELVHLDQAGLRSATRLSGGQQQRLALARALAVEPAVLLLDEPLSNLDQKLREEMRVEVKRMQRDLGVTTLYVTHDQVEAMFLSDLVAVMNNGKVEQLGTPEEIYNHPATRFVADFVGSMNFIEGTVAAASTADTLAVETALGTLEVVAAGQTVGVGDPPGTPVTLGIRPEKLEFVDVSPDTSPNVLKGSVTRREYLGEASEYDVTVGDQTVRIRTTRLGNARLGDVVAVRLGPDSLAVLPAA